MKIKFLRTAAIAFLCLLVFLATTFISSIKGLNKTDFFQGFSIGLGAVALIAAVYYYVQLQKERKLTNEQ
jgi:phosphatidylserine synthase